MKNPTEHALAKVPEVTLGFWLIKIIATTLGETGGDAVSMSLNLGYLVGTGIFAAIFLVAVAAQVKAKGFSLAASTCLFRFFISSIRRWAQSCRTMPVNDFVVELPLDAEMLS